MRSRTVGSTEGTGQSCVHRSCRLCVRTSGGSRHGTDSRGQSGSIIKLGHDKTKRCFCGSGSLDLAAFKKRKIKLFLFFT